MPIYSYSPDSLTSEVEVITSPQGGVRAYLRARSDASPEELANIQQKLLELGWYGIPCTRNGRSVLEIRGPAKAEDVAAFLQGEGLVNGPANTSTPVPEDHHSLQDKFHSATLKFTGQTYIVGDAAFMTYASMELYKHYDKLKRATKTLEAAKSAGKALGEAEELVKDAKGAVGGGWFKINSGIGYGIGSVILANYGSHDQSQLEIKTAIQKVDRFLKNEGMAAPDAEGVLVQEPEKKNQGFLEKAHDLLRRYPSEALNIVYTGVGLTLLASSLRQISALKAPIIKAEEALKVGKSSGAAGEALQDLTNEVKSVKKERRSEIIDVGLGAVTATSALAGILIKEKKPVEGEKKRGGLGGVWDWIQERPLRATGYGFMAATGFHAAATLDKWRPSYKEAKILDKIGGEKALKDSGKMAGLAEEESHLLKDMQFRRKTLMGRGVFVALNVLAEVLLIVSSKGHGEGVRNKDVDETVIASTAEYISRQNPAAQDALIQRLSGYMASPDVLGMRAEEVANELRAQVAAMKENPWAQSLTVARKAPEASPALAAAPVQQVMASPQPTPHAAAPATQISAVQLEGQVAANHRLAAGV